MTALNTQAREQLAAYGLTPAEYIRAIDMWGEEWYGDACGCPDDRCAGHHHDQHDPCRCLETLARNINLTQVDTDRSTL